MFRHIVMWNLTDPADLERFATQLRSVAGVVDGILEFDVGVKTEGLNANFDVVLVSSFVDEEAFKAYQVHPGHRKVADFLGTLAASRAIIDYVSDASAKGA